MRVCQRRRVRPQPDCSHAARPALGRGAARVCGRAAQCEPPRSNPCRPRGKLPRSRRLPRLHRVWQHGAAHCATVVSPELGLLLCRHDRRPARAQRQERHPPHAHRVLPSRRVRRLRHARGRTHLHEPRQRGRVDRRARPAGRVHVLQGMLHQEWHLPDLRRGHERGLRPGLAARALPRPRALHGHGRGGDSRQSQPRHHDLGPRVWLLRRVRPVARLCPPMPHVHAAPVLHQEHCGARGCRRRRARAPAGLRATREAAPLSRGHDEASPKQECREARSRCCCCCSGRLECARGQASSRHRHCR